MCGAYESCKLCDNLSFHARSLDFEALVPKQSIHGSHLLICKVYLAGFFWNYQVIITLFKKLSNTPGKCTPLTFMKTSWFWWINDCKGVYEMNSDLGVFVVCSLMVYFFNTCNWCLDSSVHLWDRKDLLHVKFKF